MILLFFLISCKQVDEPISDLSQDLAKRVYLAVNMPAQLSFLAYGLGHYANSGCPIVEQIDNTMTYYGDCTWDQGELEGSVTFSDSNVDWNNWSMSFGDDTIVAINGTQVLVDDTMTTNIDVEADVKSVPILPEGQGSYVYTDYTIINWFGFLGDPSSESPDSQISGNLEISDLDKFQVTGEFFEDQECDTFIDEANITLEGDQITYSYQIDSSVCDTCIKWSTDEYSGEFCL